MRTSGPDEASSLRPEIASAWRRAELSGLNPGSALGEPELAAFDEGSRLLLAAGPVLDDVAERLADTRFSLLLADRDSRIVARRLGTSGLARALDAVLAIPGNRYSEETTGTNSLASAYEVRTGIAVHGEEHFLEPLKGFTCFGCPIVHPATGRLEGVLDVTGYARDAHPLLSSVVGIAARSIEERLLAGSAAREQAMLRAYRARTARSRRPVIVFGDDMVLANEAASDLLDGTTQAMLRELAEHAALRGTGRGTVTLPSGADVAFESGPVDGAAHAVVVELAADVPGARSAIPRRRRPDDPVAATLARARRERRRVAIRGEAGTGRTHAARVLAGDAPVRFLDPDADPTLLADGLTVVEHVHLLDDVAAVRLSAALDADPSAWVALTVAPPDRLRPDLQALLARCPVGVELVALRHRRAEIPGLARAILADLGTGRGLTPAAARALMHWSWPGNVQELATVLRRAVDASPAGDLRPEDLGLDHRSHRGGRSLSPLRQAEADAMLAALRRHGGNKSHAAAELGISRTTLYRRVRELGLE
ncbi:sigma-54-dependent Fis family transcriptional regulator [Pseudonocardia endophytica]|uniref:Regulatory Fis family protein n=1 Tax=Pseudonocardia endophytica TaxID=401976 RepID=A0A4R1HXP6_PSEEN|nr:helix-turn-helix domain-containing protein [Pseudonocardia endophytica]TCK27547.1 regulatory Fis family protein [Pseudonocardia endophytica]